MSFRAKIAVMVLLAVTPLGGAVAFLLTGAWGAHEGLTSADRAVDGLYAVSVTRLTVLRQRCALAGYLHSGGAGDRERFRAFHARARAALAQWRKVPGPETGPLAVQFDELLDLLDEAAKAREAGRDEEARRLFKDRGANLAAEVLAQTDDLINRETEGVARAYDRLLVRLGAFPWTSEDGHSELAFAREALAYLSPGLFPGRRARGHEHCPAGARCHGSDPD